MDANEQKLLAAAKDPAISGRIVQGIATLNAITNWRKAISATGSSARST